MIRFFVSIVLSLGLVMSALMMEGVNPVSLVVFSMFLIVISIPVVNSFGVWTAKEICTAWSDPFFKKSRDSFPVSLKILEFQEKLFYISGITGTILGFVLILSNIPQEKIVFEELGRALAATLVGPIYGLFFVTVMRIMRARIDHTMNRK